MPIWEYEISALGWYCRSRPMTSFLPLVEKFTFWFRLWRSLRIFSYFSYARLSELILVIRRFQIWRILIFHVRWRHYFPFGWKIYSLILSFLLSLSWKFTEWGWNPFLPSWDIRALFWYIASNCGPKVWLSYARYSFPLSVMESWRIPRRRSFFCWNQLNGALCAMTAFMGYDWFRAGAHSSAQTSWMGLCVRCSFYGRWLILRWRSFFCSNQLNEVRANFYDGQESCCRLQCRICC